MRSYTDDQIAALLPYPRADMNKFTRGKCTLIVGSRNYPGAAGLSATASQRAGAGYTEVFVEDSIVAQVQSFNPSLVVRAWSEFDAGMVKPSTEKHPAAFVMGCGFDARDPYISSVTRRTLRIVKGPVLVDGGALRVMPARKIRSLCEKRYAAGYSTVMTPHGGEAKTLASIFDIPTDDPEQLSKLLSQAYGAICVLKGPNTYISDGEEVFCMAQGTAALAKAGTGDVLAGVIGALLAQGMEAVDACVLGTTIHARAGALAQDQLSSISVIAEDVVSYLPNAIINLGTGV